jgi:hypothetical protein
MNHSWSPLDLHRGISLPPDRHLLMLTNMVFFVGFPFAFHHDLLADAIVDALVQ